MSFLRDLGIRAFGSRLKSLNDLFLNDIIRIYRELDIDFEPRWYTLFQLLLTRNEVSITEIARELDQTHPSVVQVVSALDQKGLILTKKDKTDQRKRLVSLSAKGRNLAGQLLELWDDIVSATQELLNDGDPNFIEHIKLVESAYQKRSIHHRIRDKYASRMRKNLEFLYWNKKYQNDFRKLNESWLKKYVGISEHDDSVLNDPEKEIINKRGEIFLAKSGNEIIGTFAIQRISDEKCQLSKFTVKEKYRNMGLGGKILRKAIEVAAEADCKSLLLYTQPILKEANKLYLKNGFIEVSCHREMKDPTGRQSILMKLDLSKKKITKYLKNEDK